MPEIILNQRGIVSPIRQGPPATMPEHVRMNVDRDASRLTDLLEQVVDSLPSERSALRHEQKRTRIRRSLAHVSVDRPNLVGFQWLMRRQTALGATDKHPRRFHIDI